MLVYFSIHSNQRAIQRSYWLWKLILLLNNRDAWEINMTNQCLWTRISLRLHQPISNKRGLTKNSSFLVALIMV